MKLLQKLRKFISFNEVVNNEAGIAPIIAGALITALVGLAKSQLIDKPKEKKQRRIRAAQVRFSPFTKRAPTQDIQEADPFGTAFQFGGAGAALGSNIQSKAIQDQLLAKQLETQEAQTSLFKALAAEQAPAAAPGAIAGAPPIRIPPGVGASRQLTDDEKLLELIRSIGGR